MSENLKKFLDMIANDKDLEAKTLACNKLGEEKGKLAMLELAKEYGVELTLADLAKEEKPASRELDDDELDAVAGGYALVINSNSDESNSDEMENAAKGLVQLINPSSSRL